MNEKIYEVLEGFECDNGSLRQYNENDVNIATAIEEAFEKAGFEPNSYDVDCNIVFSCPSADFGYVSIAWVENGKLYHENYEFQ